MGKNPPIKSLILYVIQCIFFILIVTPPIQQNGRKNEDVQEITEKSLPVPRVDEEKKIGFHNVQTFLACDWRAESCWITTEEKKIFSSLHSRKVKMDTQTLHWNPSLKEKQDDLKYVTHLDIGSRFYEEHYIYSSSINRINARCFNIVRP